MARWHKREVFPAPLREFREEDWPPVPDECLGHYACRGGGYGSDCVPRPGEPCGQRCYAMLAAGHPPGVLAAAMRADAFTRYHQARLNWLGEGHPAWMDEFLDGDRHSEIRYAPFREADG